MLLTFYILFFHLKVFYYFLRCKLLIKFLYLRSINISFSIYIMTNPLNLFCDIIDLRLDLVTFNF